MDIKEVYIYILTNKPNGVLYIGLTANIIKRIADHKRKDVQGFTKKYNLTSLVYYELQEDQESGAQRERLMKKWKREWKVKLIQEINPEWNDLYDELQARYMN